MFALMPVFGWALFCTPWMRAIQSLRRNNGESMREIGRPEQPFSAIATPNMIEVRFMDGRIEKLDIANASHVVITGNNGVMQR